MERLNRGNINGVIREYYKKVQGIRIPVPLDDKVVFIKALKRDPLESGPYPKVSFFESGNRILSDLVLLYGVKYLLTRGAVAGVRLPYQEYDVLLGIEDGYDVRTSIGKNTLIGEGFNVSKSYFQTKKRDVIKKLQGEDVTHRIIIFNADAVKDPGYYSLKSTPSMLFLPINFLEK